MKANQKLLSLVQGKIRARVSSERGEITSLCRLWNGRWVELIYVRPKGWKGGAPWLFPAVGRNFIGDRLAWRTGGRVYPMPIHGFASRTPWTSRRIGSRIECVLHSSAQARKFFPFDFSLKVRYALLRSGLHATVEIAAGPRNQRPMPFSLGNHIAFRMPFNASSCVVRSPARKEKLLSARSLLSGRTRRADLLAGARLDKRPSLLNGVFGGFPNEEAWAEFIDPSGLSVRVSQRERILPGAKPKADPADFHFVFYGDLTRGFLCLEPWLGVPNSLNTGKGVVRLEPGQRFLWEMTVEFSDLRNRASLPLAPWRFRHR